MVHEIINYMVLVCFSIETVHGSIFPSHTYHVTLIKEKKGERLAQAAPLKFIVRKHMYLSRQFLEKKASTKS